MNRWGRVIVGLPRSLRQRIAAPREGCHRRVEDWQSMRPAAREARVTEPALTVATLHYCAD
ncbi:hypothetical protein GCM10011428_72690 [Streptomyces violaceus]